MKKNKFFMPRNFLLFVAGLFVVGLIFILFVRKNSPSEPVEVVENFYKGYMQKQTFLAADEEKIKDYLTNNNSINQVFVDKIYQTKADYLKNCNEGGPCGGGMDEIICAQQSPLSSPEVKLISKKDSIVLTSVALDYGSGPNKDNPIKVTLTKNQNKWIISDIQCPQLKNIEK